MREALCVYDCVSYHDLYINLPCASYNGAVNFDLLYFKSSVSFPHVCALHLLVNVPVNCVACRRIYSAALVGVIFQYTVRLVLNARPSNS